MIVVAVAGGLLGVKVWRDRRSKGFRQLAEMHSLNWASFTTLKTQLYFQRQSWHFRDLMDKYERAARYPWLPVEPDPSHAGMMPLPGLSRFLPNLPV